MSQPRNSFGRFMAVRRSSPQQAPPTASTPTGPAHSPMASLPAGGPHPSQASQPGGIAPPTPPSAPPMAPPHDEDVRAGHPLAGGHSLADAAHARAPVDILHRFGMGNCTGWATPMDATSRLSKKMRPTKVEPVDLP